MNDNELLTKLETVYETFSVSLRMGNGFSTELFLELGTLLEQCRKCWEGRDNIPKRAASIFVDAYSSTVSASYLYDEKKRQEIEMRADELADLIRECVEA